MKYALISVIILALILICVVAYATTKYRTVVVKDGLVVNSYDNNNRVSYIATQSGFGMKAVFLNGGKEMPPTMVMSSLWDFMLVVGIPPIGDNQIHVGEWTMTRNNTGDVDWFGCRLENGMAVKYNGVIIRHDDNIDDVIAKLGAKGNEITRDSHNVLWDKFFK